LKISNTKISHWKGKEKKNVPDRLERRELMLLTDDGIALNSREAGGENGSTADATGSVGWTYAGDGAIP
jgi:hypothetical protein